MAPVLIALLLAAPYRGEVVDVRGREVTLHYDFSDEAQLEDFETFRPPHLPESERAKVRIEEGRLVLEGTIAVRHKARSAGPLRASCVLRVVQRGNQGVLVAPPDGPYALLNLFDRGLKQEGGLLLALCERGEGKQPVLWKEVATAPAAEIDQRMQGDAPLDLELWKTGGDVYLRIGNLYRARPMEAIADPSLAFWVQEAALGVEQLTVTFTTDEDLSPKTPPFLAEMKDSKLANLVIEAPLSVDAAAARRELSRRGEEGWKRLATTVRKMEKKQAWAAVPLIEALAQGEEEGRREELLVLHKKLKAPELRLAVLRALARWYPADAALLQEGLAEGLPGRLALFRDLVPRGLAADAVKPLVEDAELAGDAYAVVKDLGARLEQAELGRLPRVRAQEGYSPAACRAFLKEFGEAPNWPLVEALVGLLDDQDEEVRRGAYLLLLTVSGKDIAPIKDFWNSWIAAKKGNYEAPHLSEPGVVAAAIERGVRYLEADLLADGLSTWPGPFQEYPGIVVGATALSVVALRAADVPKDDPAIEKAMRTLVVFGPRGEPALRGDLDGYTYALSLLAMALESVDKVRYKQLLEVVARRLVDGQLENGQWTYNCRPKEYARRPLAGDNSNTQYAILGLRSARRAGVEIDRRVWERNASFWQSSLNPKGGWGYGPKGSFDHEFSMTSAGIATLGICTESLHGLKAWDIIRGDNRVVSGMKRMGELLLKNGYEGQEIYAFYGVERACILTGTRAFEDFDWYREGAAILVATQKESGAWGKKHPVGVTEGDGYGESIDTAYALLFLKRATTGLPGAAGGGVVKVPGYKRK